MNKLLIVLALLATIGITGVIIATTAPEPPQAVQTVKTKQQPPAEYEALASELNQTRQRYNLPVIDYNTKLQASACYKADEILANDNFNHDNADGTKTWVHFDRARYPGTTRAENLAKNYSTTKEMIQAWLDSPSHRANLLSDKYTEQGLCVKSETLNNKTITVTVHHLGRAL